MSENAMRRLVLNSLLSLIAGLGAAGAVAVHVLAPPALADCENGKGK
jgi:hypothetical protein